jgi:hypothetical protein
MADSLDWLCPFVIARAVPDIDKNVSLAKIQGLTLSKWKHSSCRALFLVFSFWKSPRIAALQHHELMKT